ncbi:MAG: phytoene/squalene synthase family protein [Flavisolibacter sp.]|jgi:phytoene synthase
MTVEMFHSVSHECSKAVTLRYSTSFASAIRLLHSDLRAPIFNIYGFVRLADEIVDSFHNFDKKLLLAQFEEETFVSVSRGISLNPIMNSFQQTVNQFGISKELILAFFQSMESDLHQQRYNQQEYEAYIYGSAEVVGLMCLYVFCEGDQNLYEKLRKPARALGAAFQKVNFLRDFKSDHANLSRIYFPGCDFERFSEWDKTGIQQDIEEDFRKAYEGISKLPLKARFGVYVAYKYYYSLFRKIKRMGPASILKRRIRIPNYHKALIVFSASVKNRLRLIG